MTNVKSLLALYVKMGGSLTDTYADIAGGIPVGQYSTISDAILACSKKYSSGGGGSYTLPTASADTKGGVKIGSGLTMTGEVLSVTGGGAEKFIVTLTQESDTWTADKTIAEIVAADAAGKIVVAKAMIDKLDAEFEFAKTVILSVEDDETTVSQAAFSALLCDESDEAKLFSVVGTNIGEGDEWDLFETDTGAELPSHSSSNNGQVLGVDDGNLAWVDSNAPLVVTLEYDDPQEPTAFVGDKTYGEVFTAASAGIPCTLVLSASGASVATPVLSAVSSSGTIMLFTYDTDSSSITSIQGSASDNVTIAIS